MRRGSSTHPPKGTPVPLLAFCNRVKLMRTTISFLNVAQNTPESRLFFFFFLSEIYWQSWRCSFIQSCDNLLLLLLGIQWPVLLFFLWVFWAIFVIFYTKSCKVSFTYLPFFPWKLQQEQMCKIGQNQVVKIKTVLMLLVCFEGKPWGQSHPWDSLLMHHLMNWS